MFQFILQMLVVLEMVVVNMITINKCCTAVVSGKKILIRLLVWTLAIVVITGSLIKGLGIYGNGNGLFVLAGFLYLIPLRKKYIESLDHMLTVLCTSWIYTMFSFSISVNIAKLFSVEYFEIIALTIQTCIYLFTAQRFWRLVQNKFIYILRHTDPKIYRSLRSLSISWFLAALMIHFTLVMQVGGIYNCIVMLILMLNSYRTYSLLYDTVRNFVHINSLEQIALNDSLTLIGNRSSLLIEIDKRMQAKTPFILLFMDLDNFKQVNDTYGHRQGDLYLNTFSRELQSLFEGRKQLYRQSGDEFVYLSDKFDEDELIDRLKQCKWLLFKEAGLEFLGVSYGYAKYPKDATQFSGLLEVADKKMYMMKEKKKKTFRS